MGKFISYFTLIIIFVLTKNIGISSLSGRNIYFRDTTNYGSKIWDIVLNDSAYYYAPHNNNLDVRLSLDNIKLKNDTTLVIYASIINLSEKKICVLNLYHDNYDLEAQLLSIYFISNNETQQYVQPDKNGIIRMAQHSVFIVESEKDISYIDPNCTLPLRYQIHDKNIKNLITSSKYMQIDIDYQYGISSLIPLTNIVFDRMRSNLLELE